MDPLTAVRILQAYLKAKYNGQGSLILVGKKETLRSDNVDHPDKFENIKHFDPSHPEYYTLPANVRAAADVLNALQIMAPLKKGGKPVQHVAGYESYTGQLALRQKGFGFPLKFGPETFVFTYGFSCVGVAWAASNSFINDGIRGAVLFYCSENTSDADEFAQCVYVQSQVTC